MSSKLIRKIKQKPRRSKTSWEKYIYIALIGGILTAGFGTYFYLNRIKEFISILFLASIISCVINGNTQQNTLNTESGGRKTTIARSFNFNFGLFAAISLIDNLSALGAAKKKQLEKNANSLSFIQ